MGRCGPQWSKNIYISENLYIDFLKKKNSQKPISQRNCDLCGSIPRKCKFKFLQIMFQRGRVGPPEGVTILHRNKQKKKNQYSAKKA